MPLWLGAADADPTLGYSAAAIMPTPTLSFTNFYNSLQSDSLLPFDVSGAYFAGLSNQTSLTITVRWYIERCPTIDEIDLVVLATPSPTYDPDALRVYSDAMHAIPPGVPVGMNPAGEFFRQIVSNIRRLAPKVGRVVQEVAGVPGAALLGAAVGRVAEVVERKTTRKPSGAVTTTTTTRVPRPPPQPAKKKAAPPPKKKVTMRTKSF